MAGWLIKRLGNGLFGLVDVDNPINAPAITATISVPNYDAFTRLLQGQINNNEEIRREFTSAAEYVGLALTGSLTSNLVWNVVKKTLINNHTIRLQFQTGISWDDRTLGW